jgi:hypothetical protein
MSSAKRSCSPSGSQAKRSRVTERLCLADRIDRSGMYRDCPCRFCFYHSLSCWVSSCSRRCSQCTRADRNCLDAFPCPPAESKIPQCLAACSRNLAQMCSATLALSRNFSELSRALQTGSRSPSASSTSVASPLAASSRAYSSVSVASPPSASDFSTGMALP